MNYSNETAPSRLLDTTVISVWRRMLTQLCRIWRPPPPPTHPPHWVGSINEELINFDPGNCWQQAPLCEGNLRAVEASQTGNGRIGRQHSGERTKDEVFKNERVAPLSWSAVNYASRHIRLKWQWKARARFCHFSYLLGTRSSVTVLDGCCWLWMELRGL